MSKNYNMGYKDGYYKLAYNEQLFYSNEDYKNGYIDSINHIKLQDNYQSNYLDKKW